MIRLGTSRGVWLVHGIFQLFAYIVYIVAFGLGVWMVNNIPYNLLDSYHPIIGIVVFVLLFFQPILGFVHHLQYKKHSRRTIWSYGHLWLGRIVITLGMINGGLGMLLASDAPAFLSFRPTQGQAIAYGVIAGLMWLFWVAAVVIGERRRARAPAVAAKDTEMDDGSPPPYRHHKSRFAYAWPLHACSFANDLADDWTLEFTKFDFRLDHHFRARFLLAQMLLYTMSTTPYQIHSSTTPQSLTFYHIPPVHGELPVLAVHASTTTLCTPNTITCTPLAQPTTKTHKHTSHLQAL
jgi:hypothetical protein